MNEDKMYCKRIADELEAIARGEMYTCFDCGNIVHTINGICPECGEPVTDEDGEEYPYTLTEWAERQLDTEYIIGGDMIYKACRIYVTLGGPTIWVDTWNAEVRMLGVDDAAWHISHETRDMIDELMEECLEGAKEALK